MTTGVLELPKSPYSLYDRPGYFEQLAREISHTIKGDRIAVMTMPFEPREPLVSALVQELCAAAKRGVQVIIGVDAITFTLTTRYEFKLGPLWFHGGVGHAKDATHAAGTGLDAGLENRKLMPPFRAMYDQLESIRKAGGSYRIMNVPTHPFTLPVAGRSHIKLAVVNDTIKLGGCNLEDRRDLDIMASFEQSGLADYLFNFADRAIQHGNIREMLQGKDQHFSSDPPGLFDLFIDAGVRKQSRILDEALKLIDNSREWLFLTCQYFPGGVVGEHLAQALKRGVRVHVIFSPPSTHGYERPGHATYNTLQKLRLPRDFFRYQLPEGFPLLHAKLLANEQGAMLGSHNYATQGVRLGTAEIALHVHDPIFSRQTVEFIGGIVPPGYGFTFDQS